MDIDATDETVIDQVRAGATERFAVLMRRYNQRMFRAARAIVRDDDEAEDVVQAAYLSAFHGLPGFAARARFSTWLLRIAVHEALARVRARGRRGAELSVDDSEEASAMAMPQPSPEDEVAARELRRLLESAVDALPEGHRVVFVLRDVEGLDTAETAACLGLSDEAVRVRLHRARHLLREALYDRVGPAAPEVFAFAGERCDRIVRSVLARVVM